MQLNPAEISELIKSRIEGLAGSSDIRNEGTVVSVTDGIVRVHGLSDGFAVAYGARSSSGASSVYPMPRTVWMSFGLNASSIFARRRRMATSMTLLSLSKF